MNETTCDICEKPFERNDLEYVALKNDPEGYERPHDPKPFYACNQCAKAEKLTFYYSKWIEAANDRKRLMVENNLFRTMMMGNESIIGISNESEISIRSYLTQHKSGWEKLPLDSMHMFLTLMSGHAEFFASMMNEKASKEEIQAHLVSKTEAAKAQHKKNVEKQKIEETGLKGTYTKDETKAIKGLMKGPLKLSETAAYEMLTGMMKSVIAAKDSVL